MSSILTNNSAMVALQTLKGISKDMTSVQTEISTGKKVASSKDNAGVWAIASIMESDVSSFKAISDSLSLGQSTVAVARNASEQVTSLLQEMKTKIVAAQEENVDRDKIQADIAELRNQVSSVVGAAQFNGLNLLEGTGSIDVLSSLDRSGSSVTASSITVNRQNLEQSAGSAVSAVALTNAGTPASVIATTLDATGGTNDDRVIEIAAVAADHNYTVTLNDKTVSYTAGASDTSLDVANGLKDALESAGLSTDFTFAVQDSEGTPDGNYELLITNTSAEAAVLRVESQSGGGTGGLTDIAGIDVSTASTATLATYLDTIETSIQTATDAAAAFGSVEKRLSIQDDFINKLVDSMKSGIGSLVDADMEEASARLQALQVQQQLGTQSLSIANQAPQNILSLFR